MKVVFLEGVKNLAKKPINAKIACVLCSLLAAMCISSPLIAGKDVLKAGGRPGKSRIVFNLDELVIPRLIKEDQTLIVNFPDTIGDPVSQTDIFLIKDLIFDGKSATITMKQPFDFNTSFSEKPAKYVIDLIAKEETAGLCPIGNIQANPRRNGITLNVFIQDGMWPSDIRYAKNRRLFLIFKSRVSCSDIEQKLSRTPALRFGGALEMQGGTAIAIDIIDRNIDVELKTSEKEHKVVLDITTAGEISRSKIFTIAWKSFVQKDIASTIHTLERYKDSLTSEENILLGRAYWKIAYPYYLDAYQSKTMKYMKAGIQAMPPGIRREEILLEYVGMLTKAKLYAEAENYIKFLKESLSTHIAASAFLVQIDILNNKKMFQDAFVENRRMLSAFETEGIPVGLKAYYNSVLADTYLGLNAYSRAIKLYKDALLGNPELFVSDPGLYARMGEAAYNTGDYTTAKEYLLLAINVSRKEDKAPYLISLGDCLYQIGQSEKAMGVLSEVENMSPDKESDVIAKLKTARIIQEKDLTKNNGNLSDKAFNQILYIYDELKSAKEYEEGPLGSIIKIRIAQTYAKKRDWDNALDAYNLAWTSTKKEDPIHKYSQGEAEKALSTHLEALDTLGKYDRIFDLYTLYEDSFIKDLKNPEVMFLFGKAMNELGYLDQAHALLISCLKYPSSKTDQALSMLFSVDYRKSDYVAALKWNTRYLQEYPKGKDYVLMQAIRGEVLYHTNNFSQAVPFLEYSIRQGGKRTLTDLLFLANAYNKLGNPSAESATLEKIIAYSDSMRSPVIEKALYTRATQMKNSSNFRRAMQLYIRLLNDYPRTSYRDWALYHLSAVYHYEGNDQEAVKLLSSVIQKSTDKTLQNLANNYLNELTLDNDIDEYTKFIDRFGGK